MPGKVTPAAITTGAIILGAGFARRFGADKRLAKLSDSTVGLTTCGKYRAVFDQVRVVIRPDDDVLKQQLAALDVEIIHAEQAHQGMGHSLAAGFTDLAWTWAFVALMDMPYIQLDTLRQLKRCAEQAAAGKIITASLSAAARSDDRYLKLDQQACHPIAWHADYFAQIERCQGDQGARSILQAHREQIINVEVDDPGIMQDIDQPGDLI